MPSPLPSSWRTMALGRRRSRGRPLVLASRAGDSPALVSSVASPPASGGSASGASGASPPPPSGGRLALAACAASAARTPPAALRAVLAGLGRRGVVLLTRLGRAFGRLGSGGLAACGRCDDGRGRLGLRPRRPPARRRPPRPRAPPLRARCPRSCDGGARRGCRGGGAWRAALRRRSSWPAPSAGVALSGSAGAGSGRRGLGPARAPDGRAAAAASGSAALGLRRERPLRLLPDGSAVLSSAAGASPPRPAEPRRVGRWLPAVVLLAAAAGALAAAARRALRQRPRGSAARSAVGRPTRRRSRPAASSLA